MIHIGLMDRSPVNRPVAIALRVFLGLVTLQLLAAQACAGVISSRSIRRDRLRTSNCPALKVTSIG